MKRLLLTAFLGMGLINAQAQTARVQVIHNCADAAASQVDIYLDGTLIQDDLDFRTATPFVDITAGSPIMVGVAPGNSTSVTDTIYNITTTLTPGSTYIAVANGIVSSTGYIPAPDFGLDIYAMGREAATNSSNTDLLVMHGSTDAPTVDARSGIETLVDDISYGSFSSGYLELPTNDYKIRVTNTTGSNTVQTYSAPLSTLNLDGAAGVVLASGFLNPANNSNGPAFGLYVALPAGGALTPLPTTDAEALARLQAIHNSADMAADEVDVYINGDLAIDDFAFRTATPFLDLPANAALNIGIAPSNSSSVTDTIYNLTATLDSAETYIAIANGIVSPTGYTPAQAFRLSVYAGAREMATNNSNTDILVMHGSTDAPTVDVASAGNTLVDDIMFGEYSSAYLELPTNDYVLDITDAPGTNTVASYSANLQMLNLDGAAITVIASGFLAPGNNSNGPPFGLYAATAAGGNLVALPVYTSVVGINNSDVQLSIWPNPAQNVLNINSDFSGNDATLTIHDITGKLLIQGKYAKQVNIAGLVSGVYTLTIAEDGKKAVQNFIVR